MINVYTVVLTKEHSMHFAVDVGIKLLKLHTMSIFPKESESYALLYAIICDVMDNNVYIDKNFCILHQWLIRKS